MSQGESTESRYQRQAELLLSQGWKQEKLGEAKIAVVGSDALANYSTLTLSVLGFGNIELFGQGKIDARIFRNYDRHDSFFDFTKGFLYFEDGLNETKSKSIENIIRKINPEIKIRGVNIGMQRRESAALLKGSDIIIEATNDPASKIAVFDYALEKDIPVVSMSSGMAHGGVGIFNPKRDNEKTDLLENLIFKEFEKEYQDPIVSQVIAGIGIEEVRKIINPLRNEKVIDDIIIYNLLSSRRFDRAIDNELKTGEGIDLKDYSLCLIGAGALGNFVGLGLALRNVGRLTIVDYDVTEITNLNRQVLLYNAVGKEKAIGLAENLKRINPKGEYRAKTGRISFESADFFRRNRFDLVIDCVDNNPTRALLNYFSLSHGFPLISGGTRYNSGQVNICVPDRSGCLNCQADIDTIAINAKRRQSCIYAAQPSVITSNQITAGLMVGEVPFVLDPSIGDFAKGELKFVSGEEYRLSLLPSPVEKCECYKSQEKTAGWKEKMNEVYK